MFPGICGTGHFENARGISTYDGGVKDTHGDGDVVQVNCLGDPWIRKAPQMPIMSKANIFGLTLANLLLLLPSLAMQEACSKRLV